MPDLGTTFIEGLVELGVVVPTDAVAAVQHPERQLSLLPAQPDAQLEQGTLPLVQRLSRSAVERRLQHAKCCLAVGWTLPLVCIVRLRLIAYSRPAASDS